MSEETKKTEEYKEFQKTGITEMRPYRLGESMDGITVSKDDYPAKDQGMIARDPKNHENRWYVNREFFEKNYEECVEDEIECCNKTED